MFSCTPYIFLDLTAAFKLQSDIWLLNLISAPFEMVLASSKVEMHTVPTAAHNSFPSIGASRLALSIDR